MKGILSTKAGRIGAAVLVGVVVIAAVIETQQQQSARAHVDAPSTKAQLPAIQFRADLGNPGAGGLLASSPDNTYSLRYEAGRAVLSCNGGETCVWGVNPAATFSGASATVEVATGEYWYVIARAAPSLEWWSAKKDQDSVLGLIQPSEQSYRLLVYNDGRLQVLAEGRSTAVNKTGPNTVDLILKEGTYTLAVNGWELARAVDVQKAPGPGFGIGFEDGTALVLSAFALY